MTVNVMPSDILDRQVMRARRVRREHEHSKNAVAEEIMRKLGPAAVAPAHVMADRDARLNAPAAPFGDPTTPRWRSNKR